ncbi:DUF724 domain-containing protein 7 isoform X2 [Cannabis sativa]|uniref:DUF724 domain-containing protein 7 isoform X2 n=1 Tax=Cannabis sativa TaxID=3483 RepID=UPI0029CA308C|nr:DUF724 domain-containing protein 7 isoform X2 [Cannabis sativa]
MQRKKTNSSHYSSSSNPLSEMEMETENLHFKPGSTVEVCTEEDGFLNAWFPATVLRQPTSPFSNSHIKKKTKRYSKTTQNSKLVVKYLYMLEDDNDNLLVEKVDSFLVRPNPPPDTDPDKPFDLYEAVDAFHDEIWWTGVVVNVRGDDYTVRFIYPPDILLCKRSQLRPHWDWVDQKWVRGKKQELKYSKFRSGTAVEVNLNPENVIPAWMPAIVIGEIDGKTSVGVKCKKNIKDRDEGVFEVDREMIRPQPPETSDVDKVFEVLDKVDALCDLGWSVGVVTKTLLIRKYIVKFDHGRKFTTEMMFDRTELRYHLDWIDGKWVDKSKENLITPENRKISTCDEGRSIGLPTLNGSSWGSVTEKVTSCTTNMDEDQISPCIVNSSTFELEKLQLSTAAKAKASSTQKDDNKFTKSNQVEENDDSGRLSEPQGAPVLVNMGSASSLQDGDQNNMNLKHQSPNNDIAISNQVEELDNLGRLAEETQGTPVLENTGGPNSSFKEGDQNDVNMKHLSPDNDIAKSNLIEEIDNSGRLVEPQEASPASRSTNLETPVFENTGDLTSSYKGDQIDLNMQHQSPDNDIAKSNHIEELDNSGRLAEPQGAPVFENTGSAASFQEDQNDINMKNLSPDNHIAKSNQMEELDNSGTLAKPQESPVFENTSSAASSQMKNLSPDDDIAKSNQMQELDNSGMLVEPQEARVIENASSATSFQEGDQNNIGAICEIDRNRKQHEVSNVQGSPQNLPIVRRSAIWEFVDSLEVFKKLPQNPQFQFLAAKNEIELEVIALTNKVKFAYVIDMISKLHEESTTTDTVDSIIKQLNKLQNMGFDVELLKNYLSEFKRLKLELVDVKTQLMEHIGYYN